MELLDKNLPSDLAHTAREAAARAVSAIEPFADPLLDPLRSRRGRTASLRSAMTRHPWALGATAVILVGIAVVVLSSSGDDAADDATIDAPQRIRTAA